jgi:hypothetical protein
MFGVLAASVQAYQRQLRGAARTTLLRLGAPPPSAAPAFPAQAVADVVDDFIVA